MGADVCHQCAFVNTYYARKKSDSKANAGSIPAWVIQPVSQATAVHALHRKLWRGTHLQGTQYDEGRTQSNINASLVRRRPGSAREAQLIGDSESNRRSHHQATAWLR